MRTNCSVIVFLGFILVACIPAGSQNHDKKQSADIAAIQQVSANLDAAWNRHDAAALSELFLDNADFQWHTGELLSGRKQIEQYFSTIVFKQMPADYRHKTMIQRLRFLEEDVAIGDGTIVVFREGAAENEKPYLSVLFTCVGQKNNGHWRIAAVRLMLVKSE
ncbi:MAG: hypothetical protein A2Y62_16950 [Candidatus Fischerbacteria bacterium RBG_13_37_8]|uniref:SnoaL-like domain-containing protein n=1 Tax=Candidatus Fischerbacteria bacterium RBG_13_37_8 TaxID=1817863 RepID=A0A1F5VEB3_9BACT|nr:MAG: hypothetical protein A2Y62_16950 [Candidatus Fischerbacteria bacterium RBG_13_37_8]